MVDEYVKMISQSVTLQELERVFSKALESSGISKFGYVLKETAENSVPFHVSTFPTDWIGHYFGCGYHKIDPVLKVMDSSEAPFIWSDTWKGVSLSDKQRTFFNEAKEFGLAYGMGVPIFSNNQIGNATISFVSAENEGETERIFKNDIYKLALYATHFHYNALLIGDRLRPVQQTIEDFNLTPREVDVIKWSAENKTFHEIGIILGISYNTVLFHAKNIYLKMDVVTKQEMIVKAIIAGIVTV